MQCSSDFSRILSRWLAHVNKSVCIFYQEFSLLVAYYELQLSLMYEYSRRTSGAAWGQRMGTLVTATGVKKSDIYTMATTRMSSSWTDEASRASGSVGWCQNRSNRSKELWDMGYVWAKGQPLRAQWLLNAYWDHPKYLQHLWTCLMQIYSWWVAYECCRWDQTDVSKLQIWFPGDLLQCIRKGNFTED